MAITDIRVGEADFSLDEELSRVMRESPSAGGVASFVGLVRNKNDGSAVSRMTLEHYPGMTEKSLAKIAAAARERFHLVDVIVVHRVGELKVGDRIVLCLTSAEHRSDAFAGCEYIMDWLKTEAPFWKKEQTPDGERWVDARESDDKARERWLV
ncbi:molybdopterin synthase catalytic subunit MoaE [Sutterella wadsworthensis]|uniref:molybdopterin synthase catalytic subunit MoaE n=1 Tax=Sutterella wadsworthensis TaxID=40545 RepID=UPI0013F61DCD|nr:molybdopterin synthase catalytic subunit MoaE [Sutterella wadsworthensis]